MGDKMKNKTDNENYYVPITKVFTVLSFIGMFVFTVLCTALAPSAEAMELEEYGTAFTISALILIGTIIATFTLSIVSLTRYKEKAFSIVALIFSSIFLLVGIVSMMGG
jgi:cytochrome bd-type quinol oxidase subunit 2